MTTFAKPHWLDEEQAAWPLLAIANGERSTLTREAAQAILADWGDLLSMVGEFVMRAERAKRRAEGTVSE